MHLGGCPPLVTDEHQAGVIVGSPSERELASANADSKIEVVRLSEATGFWLWRRAMYEVYLRGTTGPNQVIVVGRFRNHKQALKKARKLLHRD